jgi:toxin ParE1/3/4
MKAFLSPQSQNDLKDVFSYIAKDSPSAAGKVIENLKNAVNLIESRPFIGRPTRFENIREWKVSSLPYLIPYRITDDEIEILRFYHTARNRPTKWNSL